MKRNKKAEKQTNKQENKETNKAEKEKRPKAERGMSANKIAAHRWL